MLRQNILSAVAGLVFALGLGLGGMTLPDKVIGFLDFTGTWNPSLAFVMGSAVTVYALGYWGLAQKQGRPWFDVSFHLPKRRDIDGRLVVGSAVFGVGWGLGGFCPGPGVASLPSRTLAPWVFVTMMILGMLLFSLFDRMRQQPAFGAAPPVQPEVSRDRSPLDLRP